MPIYSTIATTIKLTTVSGNHESDRNDLRLIAINEFAKEHAGTGIGAAVSKYRYDVETLADGRKIYLVRPAMLNKGFDFVINLEQGNFPHKYERTYKRKGRVRKIIHNDAPDHCNIFKDLRAKKNREVALYPQLKAALELVYNCHDPDDIINVNTPHFRVGYTVEEILKIVKWFFIEQDIRYWNWSGRKRFWDEVISKI